MSKLIRPHPNTVAVYTRAFSEGLFITQVLQHAKVAPSTWARLRAGAVPHKSTISKLNSAIDALVAADQEGADGTPSGR